MYGKHFCLTWTKRSVSGVLIYNGKDDPESHFDELTDALKQFREEMVNHPIAIAQIETALAEITSIVEELRSEMPQEPDADDFYGRGIFRKWGP